MKTITKKCRGYSVNLPNFSSLNEAAEMMGADKALASLNRQLTQHEWSTAFEKGLAKELVRLEIFRPMLAAVKGGRKAETPSQYLAAWGGEFSAQDAQAIADTIAFPPAVSEEDEDAPKAYQISAAANLAPFRADAEKLAKIGDKLAAGGYDNDGSWEGIVAARAKLEWNTAKAALAEEKRKLAQQASEYADL